MIPYGHQWIDEDDIRAVGEVLRSDRLTQGPKVQEFEEALAAYCGAKYCVTMANGTAALQAAYFAIGLKDGDEFITSPLTFTATANAGIWQGGRPIFSDVDSLHGNLAPENIEALITPQTRAVVPVDFAGHPVELERIKEIAAARGLPVIEDACHALGATLHGKKIGAISDLTVFSFHPVKAITTGEGGAVLTDNAEYAERLRLFRNHGNTKEKAEGPRPADWYYEMRELGMNCRLTDIQAALGLSQLKKLERFLRIRREIAGRYEAAFRDDEALIIPTVDTGVKSGWHLYPLRLKNAAARDETFTALREAGIGVQAHYRPVYLHPYYERLGYTAGLCPEAEKFFAAEISLPIFSGLTLADQQKVISEVKRVCL